MICPTTEPVEQPINSLRRPLSDQTATMSPVDSDALTPDLAEDLLELLSEAAVEILNNDIETNPVYRRLRAMQGRVRKAIVSRWPELEREQQHA